MFPTDGNWELWSPSEEMCCPKDVSSSDTLLIYIQYQLPGMLRKIVSVVFPKGASLTLHGATVYVARINNQGQLRMAKPCENCEQLLRFKGIHKVVFTTDIGWDSIELG